jgi:ABC-type multidrug transport system fused ATPase/permease subunit
MLGRFMPFVPRRRRRQFFLLALLMLVGAGAELVTLGAVLPFITLLADPSRAFEYPVLQQVFTTLGWRNPDNLVLPMTATFLGIVAVATGIRLLLTYASNRFVFALGYDIGVQLYRRVLNQPYSFHISRNTSEIIAAINKVQMVVTRVLLPLIQGTVAIVLSSFLLAGLMIVDAAVALTAIASFTVFYALVMVFMRSRLRANSQRIAWAQNERVRAVQEGLGAIRDVILDGGQPHYIRHFATVDNKLRTSQAANAFIGQAPRFVLEFIGISLIVGLALVLSASGDGLSAALPTLGALALGAQKLLPLLQQIYNSWSRVLGNRQIFADILDLLSLPNDCAGQRIASSSRRQFENAISFDGVCFRYVSDGSPVLQDVTFRIPKGARVGVVGRTGSGKSTCMDILMGLLEPTEGRIVVDGHIIDRENRQSWQNRIAHVPQNIFLADASIAENIAFGVPKGEIDSDRVREAAEKAQIADHIESTADGYETRVGERGVQLSGGQRQRIAIARALYKRAAVLVLDEATSALDDETEKELIRCISSVGNDVTVVMVAHRTTTLRNCDFILKFEAGRCSEPLRFEQLPLAAGS